MLTFRLGLTPEQVDAARAILKAAHEEAEKTTDPAAKAKLFEEAFAKIRTTVLTDEQRAKLREIRAKEDASKAGGPAAPAAKS
jgi:hypothetical protein